MHFTTIVGFSNIVEVKIKQIVIKVKSIDFFVINIMIMVKKDRRSFDDLFKLSVKGKLYKLLKYAGCIWIGFIFLR